MKFIGYVLTYYLRNKLRFFFTLMSVLTAIFLFCVLECSALITQISADDSRLLVTNDGAIMWGLPLSYHNRIKSQENIQHATFFQLANLSKEVSPSGKGKTKVDIRLLSVDGESFFDVASEYKPSPEELDQFQQDPGGCVIGLELSKSYGWKVGDQISLSHPKTGGVFEFNVRGIYTTDKVNDNKKIYCHYQYHTQKDPTIEGKVFTYYLAMKDSNQKKSTVDSIDQTFQTSFPATRTLPEKVFASNIEAMEGNFEYIFQTIGYTVLLMTLLVISNTLVMATRKQIPFFTTLRVLGYSKNALRVVVLGESMFVAIIGGGISCLLAGVILPAMNISDEILLKAVVLTILLGLSAGIAPCIIATKEDLAKGLRVFD